MLNVVIKLVCLFVCKKNNNQIVNKNKNKTFKAVIYILYTNKRNY